MQVERCSAPSSVPVRQSRKALAEADKRMARGLRRIVMNARSAELKRVRQRLVDAALDRLQPDDLTLASAFKADAITFLTARLIAGKRACKAGTSQSDRRQFPWGPTGFVPQGKAVIVQLL